MSLYPSPQPAQASPQQQQQYSPYNQPAEQHRNAAHQQPSPPAQHQQSLYPTGHQPASAPAQPFQQHNPYEANPASNLYPGSGYSPAPQYIYDPNASLVHYPPMTKDEKLPSDASFGGLVLSGRKPNDLLFAVLFLVAFVSFVLIGFMAFSRGDPSRLTPNYNVPDSVKQKSYDWWTKQTAQLKADSNIIITCTILSLLLGALWVDLLRRFSKLFIYLTLFIGITVIVLTGTWMFGSDSEWMQYAGIALWLVAFLLVLVIILLKKQINITAVTMQEACSGIEHNPAILLVAVFILALVIVFVVIWISIYIHLYSIKKDNSHETEEEEGKYSFDKNIRNLMLFMVFMFYWVIALLGAIYQHSVAGTAAAWYFSKGKLPGSPAFISLKHALTTSFGSLCFGSLILAVVQMIQYLLKKAEEGAKKSHNKAAAYLFACFRCCFGCIESIIRMVNRFAYTYVAMYGMPFCKSARAVTALFARSRFAAVIVDNLTHLVLVVGRFLGLGIIVLSVYYMAERKNEDVHFLTLFVCVAIAWVIFRLLGVLIGTAVDATFVCYMEDTERHGENAVMMDQSVHIQMRQAADAKSESAPLRETR